MFFFFSFFFFVEKEDLTTKSSTPAKDLPYDLDLFLVRPFGTGQTSLHCSGKSLLFFFFLLFVSRDCRFCLGNQDWICGV
jgi:hypothetical protein